MQTQTGRGSKDYMEAPLTITVFRGEHGPRENGLLQTRCHGYTFVEEFEIAHTYAIEPNYYREQALDPRVIEAVITIRNPVIRLPNDPFVDLKDVADKLGADLARRMAIKHAGHVENTNNWHENFSSTFAGVQELLETQPEALDRLYLEAYPLLDDPEFVAAARQAGYDGAIHIGSGVSACEYEYRVFSVEQIEILRVAEISAHTHQERCTT